MTQFLHADYDCLYVSVSKLSTWQDQSHISVTITDKILTNYATYNITEQTSKLTIIIIATSILYIYIYITSI